MVNNAQTPDRPFPASVAPIYLSAGHTAHAAEHTGIQRVTRSLARELAASGLRVEFIEWVHPKRRYVVLDDPARTGLAREGGPHFESVDSLLGRVLPEARRHLGTASPGSDAEATPDRELSEDRIQRFEAIIHQIHHPMPDVPRWIGYLPLPLSLRRALRRGIRHTGNRWVRWRDSRRIRRFIREIEALRRIHNRMTRRILKLSERRRDCAFRLAFMEQDAWRYRQVRDGLNRARNEASGRSKGTESPTPQVPPRPALEEANPPGDPAAADVFSLTHRLEPTRFRPIRGAWVVVPELMRGNEMRAVVRTCRRRRLNLAVLFHDAIAVTHPELVSESIRLNHAAYMRHLCGADLILAVSHKSADDIRDFAKRHRIPLPPLHVCANGASFGDARIHVEPPASDPVRAVCVGTLDPRKGHRALIAALDTLHRDHPSLDLRVTLIGNAYDGADDLAHEVREACNRLPFLDWAEGITDLDLIAAYQGCHFTIFPSTLEGFGLPVLESLWHGRPCICADTGATAEHAPGGGCLAVDVTDPKTLAHAIAKVTADKEFRRRLTNEAQSRVMRTWRDQTLELVELLDSAVPRYQIP